MAGSLRDQCLALAGLYQSVALVQQCARQGDAGNGAAALRTVLASVLRIDAPSTEAVYGSVHDLTPGLETLSAHLARRMDALRIEQARYAANLMFLERRLAASPEVGRALGEAIAAIAAERGERALDDPWLAERLAGAYVRHVSGLGPRILVSGEPAHLKDPANAERIRALLLAGLRSAVLWRQRGGGRMRLMVFRSRFARETALLLRDA